MTIDPADGSPDGLTVDAEGGVWVALWDGWTVRRYLPDGSVDREIRLPVSEVTCPAFGGPDLDELYITTAWELLSRRAARPRAARRGPLPGATGRARSSADAVRRLIRRARPAELRSRRA